MELYVCGVCGHVAFGAAPDKCPVCGAAKTSFKADANALKKPADPKNLTDGDKKHIPAFTVVKQCALIPGACMDVHVKIGSVLHVMEEKHWIMWIDTYLNRKFVARYEMSPNGPNPCVGMHLKNTTSGVLTAIENCNIHGKWMADVEI
ncbi:MAG: hypothetical protein HYY43_04160 [Deltaproteobacteria bacterium]|nr:hypothetical protein [Deltaproteobacteria bacterium]MBI2341582.1 hypothetical protein [Deltaproteobacteria bacterium]MBI2974763.1 hypothetical protein [Deltaproteobacteria bacterium]